MVQFHESFAKKPVATQRRHLSTISIMDNRLHSLLTLSAINKPILFPRKFFLIYSRQSQTYKWRLIKDKHHSDAAQTIVSNLIEEMWMCGQNPVPLADSSSLYNSLSWTKSVLLSRQ